MILFFPFDLLSHNLRCLQLAKAFQNDITVLFPESKKYTSFISEQGIKTFPYHTIPSDMVISSARDFSFSWIRYDLLERSFLSQIDIISKHKPTLVVGDADFTLRLAAAFCKVPFVSIVNGYMTNYYCRTRRLHPKHPGYKYRYLFPPFIFQHIITYKEKTALKKVHEPFQALAQKYNLRMKKNLLEELEGDITLIADIPEMFPQKTLPDTFHFIGPLFHEENNYNHNYSDLLSSSKANIVVSMGSTGNFEKLIMLKDPIFSEFNFIMTGCSDTILNAGHIHRIPFANLSLLLKQTDLLICHAGNGTIYHALKNNCSR
ncbi:MAG: hypothetical protein ACK40G_13505 [Cytophagaceae bacterium]